MGRVDGSGGFSGGQKPNNNPSMSCVNAMGRAFKSLFCTIDSTVQKADLASRESFRGREIPPSKDLTDVSANPVKSLANKATKTARTIHEKLKLKRRPADSKVQAVKASLKNKKALKEALEKLDSAEINNLYSELKPKERASTLKIIFDGKCPKNVLKNPDSASMNFSSIINIFKREGMAADSFYEFLLLKDQDGKMSLLQRENSAEDPYYFYHSEEANYCSTNPMKELNLTELQQQLDQNTNIKNKFNKPALQNFFGSVFKIVEDNPNMHNSAAPLEAPATRKPSPLEEKNPIREEEPKTLKKTLIDKKTLVQTIKSIKKADVEECKKKFEATFLESGMANHYEDNLEQHKESLGLALALTEQLNALEVPVLYSSQKTESVVYQSILKMLAEKKSDLGGASKVMRPDLGTEQMQNIEQDTEKSDMTNEGAYKQEICATTNIFNGDHGESHLFFLQDGSQSQTNQFKIEEKLKKLGLDDSKVKGIMNIYDKYKGVFPNSLEGEEKDKKNKELMVKKT